MTEMYGDIFEFLDDGVYETSESTYNGEDVLVIEVEPERTVVEADAPEYVDLTEVGPTSEFGLSSENATFTHVGLLSVGVGTIKWPVRGGSFTILSVAATLVSPPTGSSAIVDVNKNGSSIYGNQAFRPTFSPGAYDATVGTHSVAQLDDGDNITVDIDQIGSTSPGTTLVVVIRMQRIA